MSDRGQGAALAYDRLAQYYEWEHRDFRDDFPLYLGFARSVSGPILDAACGTGRVLLPLVEAGYLVTGVDRSSAMLKIARSKVGASSAAKRAKLVQSDLRTMELPGSYQLGLVGLGGFNHLLTTEDQRQALSRLAAHILPGGLLVLDLVNPTPEWMAAGDGALVHRRTGPFPGPDGPDFVDSFVARTLDFATQTERSLLIYDRTSPEGAVTRESCELETRFLFRYEAELLLAETGFGLRDLYGGYELDSYQGSSPRLVFVAERRG